MTFRAPTISQPEPDAGAPAHATDGSPAEPRPRA
jgi:hypothetical protein